MPIPSHDLYGRRVQNEQTGWYTRTATSDLTILRPGSIRECRKCSGKMILEYMIWTCSRCGREERQYIEH